MWLGEQITERGIGQRYFNHYSPVLSRTPASHCSYIEQARQGDLHFLVLLLAAVLVFAVTFFVVFVERGQRRIVVNYAKRQQGRRLCCTE